MQMIDETARLDDLVSKAKQGFEYYKPVFDEMTNAYLLTLSDEICENLYKRNKSKLFFPKINSKVKRIMDALSETYFSSNEFCKVESFINSNQEVLAKWQNAINFYSNQCDLYRVFQPEFLKISFLGTSVAKIYWAENMPKIEIVDIDNVYFDPDARDFSDLRYLINRIFLTKADLRKLKKKKIFKFNDDLFNETNDYERFEIYEIYEYMDDSWVVSSVYENEILRSRVKLHDGLPFVVGYMLPQVKRINESNFVALYGEPNLASILPLQKATNNIANSAIDGLNALIKPKLIVDKNSGIDRLDIETIGKPLFSSNPSNIGIVPPPQIAPSFNILEIFDRDMSDSSGISPQLNGVAGRRQETATMSSIMANEGGTRLQGYIRTYNETFFEPIFKKFAELVWFYGDKAFFSGYERGELGSYRINLNTGIGALNKEVQKNSLIEVSGLLDKHLQICMATQDLEGAMRIKEAHKRLIEKLLPFYGIKDEILGDKKDDFIANFISRDNQAELTSETSPNQQPQFPQGESVGAGMVPQQLSELQQYSQ